MTVYIVSDHKQLDFETNSYVSKYDYTPAEKFGKLEFLLSSTANPFKNMDVIIQELHSKLQNSTMDDYLILSGNPVLMSTAAAIMAFYNEGWVNLLQWNGYQKEYSPLTFQINLSKRWEIPILKK